jgi:hypothetical protein
MGLTGCPETSVRNYHYLLRNNREQCSSNLFHDGSLKLLALTCMVFEASLLLLLLLLLTAIELSHGDSSPYTSTDKTNKNKYT